MDKILRYGTRILDLPPDFQARIDKRAQEIRESKEFEQFTIQSITEQDDNPKGPFPNRTSDESDSLPEWLLPQSDPVPTCLVLQKLIAEYAHEIFHSNRRGLTAKKLEHTIRQDA